MKTIHTINCTATFLTLCLYLLLFPGMLAQLILGPLQLLLAIIISVKHYKELDQHHQILIIYYWFACISALIIALVTWGGTYGQVYIYIGLFVIPMMVAIYFGYVTSQLNKHLN